MFESCTTSIAVLNGDLYLLDLYKSVSFQTESNNNLLMCYGIEGFRSYFARYDEKLVKYGILPSLLSSSKNGVEGVKRKLTKLRGSDQITMEIF